MRRRVSTAAALVILFTDGCSVEDSGGDASARGDNKSKHHHKRDGRDGHGHSRARRSTGGSRRRSRRVPLPTDLRRATTPSPTLSTVTTVKVARRGETSIRVIGIDIPETVHPTEPVGCGGPRASRLATRLLTGEQVGLVFAVRKLRSCRGHPLRSPLTIIPRHQPLVADHELDATFVRLFDGRTQSPSRRNTENNHGVRD